MPKNRAPSGDGDRQFISVIMVPMPDELHVVSRVENNAGEVPHIVVLRIGGVEEV